MKRKGILIALGVIVLLIAIFMLFRTDRLESGFYAMGTVPCKVVTYGRDMLEFDGDLSAVEGFVKRMEGVFNAHDKSSELSRMNRSAYDQPFKASGGMIDLIDESRGWVTKTRGSFDPSVGPIIALWKSAAKMDALPTKSEVDGALGLIGFNDFVKVEGHDVSFAKEGVRLDFGAIAKGAIVDGAVKLLRSRGVTGGLVEAGGDAFAFGDRRFRFGIQDPTSREKLMGTLEIGEGAVVTSGNYERYSEIDGKRYSHIINPRTGYPVKNDLISVTVTGGSAASADAMATALMVMGLHAGIELIRMNDGMGAIFVEQVENGFEVWVSKSLKSRLIPDGGWGKNIRTY